MSRLLQPWVKGCTPRRTRNITPRGISMNSGPTKTREYEELLEQEIQSGAYLERREFVEPDPRGYIGPITSTATIMQRLKVARDWLALKPSLGVGPRKHYRESDKRVVAEIVVACVN